MSLSSWDAERFFHPFGWLLLAYFLALNSLYLALLVSAAWEMWQHLLISRSETRWQVLGSRLAPRISILAPAHNEAATITESVRSLLTLYYANLEVILVNDGSSDETLEVLAKEFELVPLHPIYRQQVKTKPVRGLYISRTYPHLVVVDKENGGKADALNVGLNLATGQLVCSIDADTLIEADALQRMVQPFLWSDDVLAAGGTIRIANGSLVKGGRVIEARAPHTALAGLQVVEYLRAFLLGRLGWNHLGGNLVISGAFGLFQRAAVIGIGGYERATVGEDMEIVARLRRHAREHRLPDRVTFLPAPVAWTEAPESRRILASQRERWHRGLAEVLSRHRTILLNWRYGALGLVVAPYYLLFELLAPVVEVLGLVGLAVGLAAQIVSAHFLILFFLVAYGFGLVLTIGALLLEELSYRRYGRIRDRAWLTWWALIENVGYRQWALLWRLRGLVRFLLGKSGWGVMERRGFGVSKMKPPRPVPAPVKVEEEAVTRREVVFKWSLAALAAVFLAFLVYTYRARTEVMTSLAAAAVPLQPLAPSELALTDKYPESFPLQVAVLLTREDEGGLGLVHALREMGIPFFVTRDLARALHHPLVFIYPEVDAKTFSADQAQQLARFVAEGGQVFAQDVFARALGSLFGFSGYQPGQSRHWVAFAAGSDPVLRYLDRPEEKRVRLAGDQVPELFTTNGYTPDRDAAILARFEDGSAALFSRPAGRGKVYISGVGLDDVILRSQDNRHLQASRAYVNAFEPGADVWMLILRAWYEDSGPAVRLATMPRGWRSVLLLSHDIDWEYSVPRALEFAAMEARHHVSSTFFMQTKYVSDATGPPFFFGHSLEVLRNLYARGFDVESHTVTHSRAFNKFLYGSGQETYANYRPRAVSSENATGGSVLGEVRVSKELLDGAIPHHRTIFFRAGHLRVPPSLPEALERCGYEFDSSFTAPDVLTNFPYLAMRDLDFAHESSIYEFPVTIEDEEQPPLRQRVGEALEVIRANADNGATNVLLIHTDDPKSKVPAEESLLDQLPAGVAASDMLTFARFWRARDRLKWSVQPGSDSREVILKARSAEAVSGLTFEFARGISGIEGPGKVLDDLHRLVLPDLPAGADVSLRIRYEK